jgi:2',3'-cyclic-nucleotide 2'-phosphodiesterase (5'-nucleotidase family)
MDGLKKLVILHTNDIHSHFGQIPKIAAFIEQQRNARGEDGLLVLDIGDHMDRMRMETEGTDGAANVAVLNASGYDAVTLGNNEGVTFTVEALDSLYRKAEFAVVGSNLRLFGSNPMPSWLLPYHIVQKSGISIGLIGVTAFFADYYRILGWDIQEPVQTVAKLTSILRPQVDVLIVMSHLGLKNDEQMAKQIEGIDIILGGHTHHLLENPLQIGHAYVGAAGKFGQYVGVIELEFDMGKRRIVSVSGYCENVDSYPGSRRIETLIDHYAIEAKQQLSREICQLNAPLDIDWHKESHLGNLLAAGIRSWVGADIGLVNAGQLLEGLRAGKVDQGRLLEICPSPINPCKMWLKGEHILEALEQSLLSEFQEKRLYGFGFRGKVLGTLCVDGMKVEYDARGPDYGKIRNVWIGDTPLQLDREYAVGTIDMFTFGIGYSTISLGRETVFFLPHFLRDVLEKQLLDNQAIQESRLRRWHEV